MRISDAPKLKDMDTNVYGPDQIILSEGILDYFKKRKEADWLDAEETMYYYDLLLKIKYGDRRLNSLGQYMYRDAAHTYYNSVFTNGCDMIWGIHHEEWDKLWKSYIAEYNPIWNVDGTETTTETRDLEDNHTGTDNTQHTGTVTLGKSGNDSDVRTGNVTNAKTGTDTDTKSGSLKVEKDGYDQTDHDVSTTLAKTGSETTHTDYVTDNDFDIDLGGSDGKTNSLTKGGSETNVHSGSITDGGSETVTHKINGFNSATAVDADADVRSPNLTKTFNNETNTLTFNQRTDSGSETINYGKTEHHDDNKDEDTDVTLSFTNREDTETVDGTDKVEYNSSETTTYNQLKDTHGYGSTDTETYNQVTDTHNYNSTDTQTFANSDNNSKNLTDTQEGTITTEHTRQGNIGVTMTQQMLQADLDYWLSAKALFFENVIKDIVNDLCYKIQVDEYI